MTYRTERTPLESATDVIGQPIRVGDYVAYATVSGRSPVQKIARVESVFQQKQWYEWTRGEENPVRDEVKVGVTELFNGRNFIRWDSFGEGESRWAWTDGGSRMGTKKPRTTYPMVENMVKLDSETVEEKLRDSE